MAVVPRTTGPSVALGGIPDARQQNPVNADLLNISAKQTGQLGNALEQAGGTYDVIQRQMVDRANSLRVDDAYNKAQETALRLQHDPKDGYTTLKGFDALNRESGQPLAVEYTGRLDKSISDIASTLGNDRQRELFNKQVNNLRTQFLGGAMRYEGDQAQVYDLSVRDATVKNAANALVLNFSDPTNVAQQTTRIRASILGARDENGVWVPGAAQMQGKSAAWGEEKAAEAVSGAHLGAIQAAMEAGNVNGAMAYRKKYADQLIAPDMLKIDGTLQRNYDTMQGAAVGTKVIQSAQSVLAPNDMDRLTNVIMGAESGGRDFDKNGNILTSPKGAQGRMQVMPATNKDPGFGVRPAADDSAEERARVGRDYLSAMVKRYDGNVAMAAAAYNAGPGAVDKAVKAAGENGDKFRGAGTTDWLASMPAETRNYVATVTKRMSSQTDSAPPRPTLEQLQQSARAQLGNGASPLAVKTAVDTVTQQFEAQTKAIEQRKTETVSETMQMLVQNGGRFSELPAAQRNKLTQLAPDKVDEVMGFGQKIAKGDDTTDSALYLKLSNDQPYLKNLSDAQFYTLRTRLSQSDFQHFANERATLSKPTGANSPGNLDTSAVSRVANQRLSSIGIDPSPKDATADAQRVGAIRRTIDASLLDAQQAAGKKFNDAEVAAHIDNLFAKNVTFRSTFLGFTTGGVSGQPLLAMRYGDVPSASVDAIKKAFAARGNSNPTEGDILGAYFAGKARAPAQNPGQ